MWVKIKRKVLIFPLGKSPKGQATPTLLNTTMDFICEPEGRWQWLTGTNTPSEEQRDEGIPSLVLFSGTAALPHQTGRAEFSRTVFKWLRLHMGG